jgi:hypothetical protein
MLPEEAQWFRHQLNQFPPDTLFPLLNVGSSTFHFRTVEQPWMDKAIFEPLRTEGYRVVHADVKAADGVDLVGDVTEPTFLEILKRQGFRSVLCSNLLEHLEARGPLCRAIVELLPANGYIFASCPYGFPYHPDPIDTRFRPTVAELAEEFPGTRLIRGDIVAGYTFWQQINRGPRYLLKLAVRMMLPFYKPKMWFSILHHTLWWNRPFTATCVVLQKLSV